MRRGGFWIVDVLYLLAMLGFAALVISAGSALSMPSYQEAERTTYWTIAGIAGGGTLTVVISAVIIDVLARILRTRWRRRAS